jgi:hypothetical protein
MVNLHPSSVDDEPATSTHSADVTRDMDDTIRTWLVERMFSDDEHNLIILVYATPDGEHYHPKERAVTSFTGAAQETYAARDVPSENVADVTDPDTRERYATEATRMAAEHDPDDTL